MHANEIYANLAEKMISARMIADALGVTNQSVSEVIRNGRGSRRIAEAISKVIQKDLIEVFPYYVPNMKRQERMSQLKQLLNGE